MLWLALAGYPLHVFFCSFITCINRWVSIVSDTARTCHLSIMFILPLFLPTLCSLHNLLLLCHYPQLQTYPGQCPEHSQVYKSPPRTKTLGRGFMSSHSWGRHPSIYYQTLNLHRHHLCALSPQITPRGFSPLFSVWLSKVLLILIFISVRFHLCSEKCWGYGRGSYIE